MHRIMIQTNSETKPEELLQEAALIGHFLKDVLYPVDDDLNVGMEGKWGIAPVLKYQLALIERAEEMLEGSGRPKPISE